MVGTATTTATIRAAATAAGRASLPSTTTRTGTRRAAERRRDWSNAGRRRQHAALAALVRARLALGPAAVAVSPRRSRLCGLSSRRSRLRGACARATAVARDPPPPRACRDARMCAMKPYSPIAIPALAVALSLVACGSGTLRVRVTLPHGPPRPARPPRRRPPLPRASRACASCASAASNSLSA